MPKTTNWKRLEFFTLLAVTTLICSVDWQRMGTAEVSPSARSIPERLEKVRQQVQFLQTLPENPALEGESATSPDVEQNQEDVNQWTNWPNWSDQWSNWSDWQNWQNWQNY